MTSVILALIGLANASVLAGAFSYMARSHARERAILVNAALSRTAAEFAARQRATETPTKAQSDSPSARTQLPEGL